MSAKDSKSGFFSYFYKAKGKFLTRKQARNRGDESPFSPPWKNVLSIAENYWT